MKLIGNLKKQVENSKSMDESRSLIEKAGMKLTDDELEIVTGGVNSALTELDEEGIDIGGSYCLEWNGSTRS